MIEDVHEPLELYKTFFREAHARNTSEFFEDLVRQSGVDERGNAKTVDELRVLERQVDNESNANKWWRILRGVVIAVLVICLIYVLAQYSWPWLIVPAAAFAPVIYKTNQVINNVSARLKNVEQQRDAKREEAWQQMAVLNQLFSWDTVATLMQKTVPRLALDDYFSNGRLSELRDTFGWQDQLDNEGSVTFVHSGQLNGNPFVLARTLHHWMGTKIYSGSLDISWTEQVRDTDGRWTSVTRHETLRASVEKPFPEYGNRTFIIYGNEAAPDLSFSRSPSKLSKLEDGVINSWKKRRAIKQLEVKSRDIKDGKGFMVMANREFDALFGASDRDHEVQFRLLFTPLAQQEMLKLLKDHEVGYGDDFEFVKRRMVNIVEPAHMMATDIDVDPKKFHAYELTHMRKFFNDYHNDFFKSFYFGIAPLLAIPLYQQYRSHADIYKDVYSRRSCFWEHEAIANHFGERQFQHPECVTRSVLKAVSIAETDDVQTVRVTAHGYRSVNQVTYVPVHGGDGRFHDVRVDWVEYFDVQRESDMVVQEKSSLSSVSDDASSGSDDTSWQNLFKRYGIDPQNVIQRRSIVSAVLPKNGGA